MFPEFCGHDVHRIVGGPIVDRDNFFEKSRQKLQKTKNGTLRWYTNSASQDTLQNQVDHSDQKVLCNRYGISKIQAEVKVLGRKEKVHECIYID